MKNAVLIMLALIMAACSSTVTGPITGKKYSVDVGGTNDMRQYRDDRKEVMDDKCKNSQKLEEDCPAQEKEENKSN
jgi:hypothetical protein